ncbi:MAG: hypothetical protein AAGA69_06785 [Pseudomonadota bacterium]
MTTMSNRNVVVAVSVVAAMFLGQSVSSVYAQETDNVDVAKVSADTASYTADMSEQLSLNLAVPTVDMTAKLADMNDRLTIKPDYASYERRERSAPEPVVVASSR